jgi:hypothetical protein
MLAKGDQSAPHSPVIYAPNTSASGRDRETGSTHPGRCKEEKVLGRRREKIIGARTRRRKLLGVTERQGLHIQVGAEREEYWAAEGGVSYWCSMCGSCRHIAYVAI